MNHSARQIIKYHEATKHHYHRYARSPGHMDWENQPHPFRIYSGCRRIELPLLTTEPASEYDQMYRREDIPPSPLDSNLISIFLSLSMGLSAWKASGGGKWALRINPSSGNLHPTEAHLILPNTKDTPAGVYHYSPLFHALEQRAVFSDSIERTLFGEFSNGGFFVGLTSIFWRESWKYGERAFRYCNHDVGHALAALSLSAALQGRRLSCLLSLSDEQIVTLLGLDRVPWDQMNVEHPDVLCFVHGNTEASSKPTISEAAITAFSGLTFTGGPNRLGKSSVKWEAIDEVADHAGKPITKGSSISLDSRAPYHISHFTDTAAQIIRKRRSAVSF